MAKDTTHLRLRIDPARLAKLEKAAEKSGRTLTGEITHRLDESFKKEDMIATLEAFADQVAERLGNVVVTHEGERVTIKRNRE
jgi:hypothetical protein